MLGLPASVLRGLVFSCPRPCPCCRAPGTASTPPAPAPRSSHPCRRTVYGAQRFLRCCQLPFMLRSSICPFPHVSGSSPSPSPPLSFLPRTHTPTLPCTGLATSPNFKHLEGGSRNVNVYKSPKKERKLELKTNGPQGCTPTQLHAGSTSRAYSSSARSSACGSSPPAPAPPPPAPARSPFFFFDTPLRTSSIRRIKVADWGQRRENREKVLRGGGQSNKQP